MIGKPRHRHLRDQRLGRQATLDQPRRRGHLHDRARAGAAGKFRPPCHDHPVLRGDDIQPLGDVGADLGHRGPAARACGVLGSQRHLDTRQVARQLASACAALCRTVAAQLGIALLRLGFALRDRLLERFQAQLELFFWQPLGFGAELHPPQFAQQVVKPVVLLLQGIALAQGSVALCHRGQQQRAQFLDIVGKVLNVFGCAVHHGANPKRQRSVCESL